MISSAFTDLVLRHGPARVAAGEMPARDRLLAALQCRPTDRIPICVPGFDLYRWADESYDGVLEAIARWTDPIHETILAHEPLLPGQWLQVDEERLPDGKILRRAHTPLGPLCEVMQPLTDGSTHAGRARWWIEDADDVERFLALPWEPPRRDYGPLLTARDRLGPHALTIISLHEPLQVVHDLLGTERLCLWSAIEPGLVRRLLDITAERIDVELADMLAHGLGPVYRIAGSEMAIPPLMNLRKFEEYSSPYLAAMIEPIHRAGHLALVHCHGAISRIIERFAALGADGVDPCEPPPIGDLDLIEAVARMDKRLSLWGNIEYDVLSEAPEAEIARLVERALAAGAPGSGFVLVTSCRLYQKPLAPQTRQNVLRMIEAARRAG